jgi:hypothetical protein
MNYKDIKWSTVIRSQYGEPCSITLEELYQAFKERRDEERLAPIYTEAPTKQQELPFVTVQDRVQRLDLEEQLR